MSNDLDHQPRYLVIIGTAKIEERERAQSEGLIRIAIFASCDKKGMLDPNVIAITDIT